MPFEAAGPVILEQKLIGQNGFLDSTFQIPTCVGMTAVCFVLFNLLFSIIQWVRMCLLAFCTGLNLIHYKFNPL
ncbi:hypothetical protein NM61103_0529 [Neisseria meningitidis 61103]|uniref:Uncharacterized protein n=1 Tax=Neisseria meningitidis TaxID=487 RepID=A0A1V3SQ63_NEIME|nr:hypothetical protein NM61103_0529 [Neisseria meningitidis 61103]EOB62742.1 hypothetical protein NM63023_0515 [Neisseria meningitidis 63023]EOB62992.1 hypothetical protein NM61106_0576 [Neisseria meningitidis 61106]EQC98788.1 hypothetical protein NM3141_1500 [Neisseria meningitidis NM3141]MBG8598135.1 hypothetical protein [Neisseria meningitidis]